MKGDLKMKPPYSLSNEKESVSLIKNNEELKAKYQAVFLTILILDQIKSKQWSNYRTMALKANHQIP